MNFSRLIDHGNRKLKEWERKAKSYPFKAKTRVTERIDPRIIDGQCEGDMMRLPDMAGHNIWHFTPKGDRDKFAEDHLTVEVWDEDIS